ncbi:uncharacterized protein L969DRAFT_89984 [Mixia osmundae IAM 14324]|uniref:CCZ1/INTU/HSP4 first Longin domain-containing protein n=1 Tax=Mixia osmundae (strain CBS 9802 / IAM 14324 / JCM 22182 / KY 12970) TaxID=764103 RepID=G7DUT1_MIXOS|nr:uncharacterized protein L969DRAFT_89984 [Mixia osmundae IAM 14324]KEI37441.1 hypothetical protein L969DRAFT_89984 [Mixia osmundae IAM 14324]GAA94341.1 hypothetical protein E5Q_00992 [Mixia osmundae IAM 14324]
MSASLPFPSLSWFAIWNRDLPRPSTATEDDETRHDVLFYHVSQTSAQERQQRRIGLAQGMVDFTRMMSRPDQAVQSVHSARQRMIFAEPEPGYWLHAAIDLPCRASRSGSNAPTVALDEGLEDEALLRGLHASYRDFKLRNGTFAKLLNSQGRATLEALLKLFYTIWLAQWNIEQSLLGSSEYLAQINALPLSSLSGAEGRSLNLTALAEHAKLREALHKLSCGRGCFALWRNRVVLLPTDQSCTPIEISALVRLLQSVAPHPLAPLDEGKTKLKAEAIAATAQESQETSKWTVPTLGLGGSLNAVGQYVPSMSTIAKVTRMGSRDASNASTPPPEASSGWIRSMSWGKGRASPAIARENGKNDESTEGPDVVEVDEAAIADALRDQKLQRRVVGEDSDDETASESSSTVANHISSRFKDSPKDSIIAEPAEVAPDDQLEPEPFKEQSIESPVELDTGEELKAAQPDIIEDDAHGRIRVHLDSASTQGTELVWQQIDYLMLGYIVSDDDEKGDLQTKQLAQELHDVLQAKERAYVERAEYDRRSCIIASGTGLSTTTRWPQKTQSWSGHKHSGQEADVISAVWDFQRLAPQVTESYVRTGSSQWVISKRHAAPDSVAIESHLFLPKQFGKESSLVDAEAEARRFGTVIAALT